MSRIAAAENEPLPGSRSPLPAPDGNGFPSAKYSSGHYPRWCHFCGVPIFHTPAGKQTTRQFTEQALAGRHSSVFLPPCLPALNSTFKTLSFLLARPLLTPSFMLVMCQQFLSFLLVSIWGPSHMEESWGAPWSLMDVVENYGEKDYREKEPQPKVAASIIGLPCPVSTSSQPLSTHSGWFYPSVPLLTPVSAAFS